MYILFVPLGKFEWATYVPVKFMTALSIMYLFLLHVIQY